MTKTITRADLANAVYTQIGFSHAESSELVDAVLEEISQAFEREEETKLSSFGTFKVRRKKARVGRNPKTKQEVPITPRKVVSFHASNILTDRVNSKSGSSESGGGFGQGSL